MVQNVKGKDFADSKNATIAGDTVQLNAGGAAGGLWAWAEYCAPITPLMTPNEVHIFLADLNGQYWLSVYDWDTNRWNHSGPFTDLSKSIPTTSAFWAVHVYGDDSLTVLGSALWTQP